MTTDIARAEDTITGLSVWIDTWNGSEQGRNPEAITWGRVAKVAEEAGEAIAALIAVTGQNPRKGKCGQWADVRRELLDTALSSLCAVAHLDGNQVGALRALLDHIEVVGERAAYSQGAGGTGWRAGSPS